MVRNEHTVILCVNQNLEEQKPLTFAPLAT